MFAVKTVFEVAYKLFELDQKQDEALSQAFSGLLEDFQGVNKFTPLNEDILSHLDRLLNELTGKDNGELVQYWVWEVLMSHCHNPKSLSDGVITIELKGTLEDINQLELFVRGSHD
jgi:hypothetical protein